MFNRLIPMLRSPLAWRLGLACYWVTLFVLTHIPNSNVPRAVASNDKLTHVVAFAVLSALLAATWHINFGRPAFWQLSLIWLGVVAYAAFDEWSQPFVGRHASVQDWIADSIGAAIGIAIYFVIRQIIQQSRPSARDGRSDEDQ